MAPQKKILFMIPLVIVLIAGIKLLLPTPVQNSMKVDHFWTKKTHGKDRAHILIYGDSRIFRGISGEKVQETLMNHPSVLNLGYSAAGMNQEMYDFLDSRLAKDGPRVIILGVTANSLMPSTLANEDFREIKSQKKLETLKDLKLKPALSFFGRYKPDNIFFKIFTFDARIQKYEVYHDDGWVATDSKPVDSSSALGSYVSRFKKEQFDPQIYEGLISQVKKWNKEGVTVIGFRPPTSVEMRDLEDERSGSDFKKIESDFREAGGIWLDFHFPDYVAYDGSHLETESALKLSEDLGNKIQKYVKPDPHPVD